MRFRGMKGKVRFDANVEQDEETSGTCKTCGRDTRRSKYGILHRDCAVCRYLKMIYSPSISVERIK